MVYCSDNTSKPYSTRVDCGLEMARPIVPLEKMLEPRSRVLGLPVKNGVGAVTRPIYPESQSWRVWTWRTKSDLPLLY
jgi:hypothetical protein